MMNFVCVLRKDAPTKKSPGFYDKEWVNKLYRAIQRNYDKPFKFFCLSNVQTDVETIPLITNWKGWWSKIELFRPNLFQGPVTYIDLDIVICNNITSLIDKLDSTKFWMVEEPGNIVNSSIMHWQGDYSHLYKKLSTDQEAIQNKFKKGKVMADQGFIQMNQEYNFINHLEPDSFNWKHHKINTPIMNPKFLIFISRHHKPSNNTEMDLVKKNWI